MRTNSKRNAGLVLNQIVLTAVGAGVAFWLAANAGNVSTDATSPNWIQHETPGQAIAAQHGCWSGDAPAAMQGKTPGHVVVSVDGHVRYSSRLVGAALEDVFGRNDPRLSVIAFCR